MSAVTKNATSPQPDKISSANDGAQAWRGIETDPVLQRIQPTGMPLLFEDEGLEMGESKLHSRSTDILVYGVESHLADHPEYMVFDNLNLYYSKKDPLAYVSPDLMIVKPTKQLPEDVASYTIGEDGPGPVLVAEVLSFRTYQEGDLTNKPIVYAAMGVVEYLLIDVTGDLMKDKLLLLRRRPDGKWLDEQDGDGGVTSCLGFRVVVEADGKLRVLDAASGKRYIRPEEAEAAVRQAESKIEELQAELARLQGKAGAKKNRKKRE